MDLESLKKTAREKLQGYCRVCPVCNGLACVGEVPGMGGVGTGGSFRANMEALARYRLNMRTLHGLRTTETSIELWGERLALPVLAAPLTGTSYNMGGRISEEVFSKEIIAGALLAGTIGMTGDGAAPSIYKSGLNAIGANSGKGIAIIKPRTQGEIISRIRQAEEVGAIAVGMDIDGAGLITMALKGQAVETKTPAQLKELVEASKLPFILKGIMTSEEAKVAREAGVAAIVVSNHGGRVLDCTPGTAEVLPLIAHQIRGELPLIVDGGVRTGADILKLLALGANAVLIGRPLIVGVFGGGREGVAFLLDKIKDELIQAMLLTGTSDVKSVRRNILYENNASE